jgi:ABC-type phosphate transport system substrate-binding protein
MAPIMHIFKRCGALMIGLAFYLRCGAAEAVKVVTVVSAKSPVTALSKVQIVDIFMGNTGSLPYGVQLVPIDQPEGSAVRDKFYAKLASKSAAQMKAHWSKIIFTGRGQPPQEAQSGAQVRELVANNPDAIGYIEEKMIDDSPLCQDSCRVI